MYPNGSCSKTPHMSVFLKIILRKSWTDSPAFARSLPTFLWRRDTAKTKTNSFRLTIHSNIFEELCFVFNSKSWSCMQAAAAAGGAEEGRCGTYSTAALNIEVRVRLRYLSFEKICFNLRYQFRSKNWSRKNVIVWYIECSKFPTTIGRTSAASQQAGRQ